MRENYWTRRNFSNKRYSRRTVLKTGAAGAAGAGAFAIVGCGDDDDDDDDDEDPTATAAEGETPQATATSAPTEPTGGPVDGSFYSTFSTLTGTTLDLHRELYRGIAYSAGNAYNNLLKFTDMENFVISGEIARGLPEQPDELTYTFTIRDDVNWHNKAPANGRGLTMDDVLFNIERQRSRTLASGEEAPNFYRGSLLYANIDSVDAVDETTFTVTMQSPQVTWLGDMTDEFNAIQFPDVALDLEDENNFGTFDARFIVGTGAWIFDEFDPSSGAHAVRNDDYFLRKDGTIPGMADELFWVNLGNDINPRRIAFEQKQLDEIAAQKDIIEAIEGAQPDAVRREIGNPNSNLEFAYNYTTNLALSVEPIRKAMFLAVDRNLVAQQQFQGLARPNPAVNWPFTNWSLPQEELLQAPGYRTPKDQDIADARALWEQGGAEDMQDSDFLMTIVDSADQSIKEWFPAMMNENLGTSKWDIQAIPVATLLEYNTSGQASVGYLGGWDQWNNPDPRTRFAQVYSGGPRGTLNFWDYQTETMENYITQMFETFDLEEAQEIIKEAQRFALTDAGSGHLQMVGGLALSLYWPYLHRKGPFFITYETTLSQELWIDQNDPSFAGKSRP